MLYTNKIDSQPLDIYEKNLKYHSADQVKYSDLCMIVMALNVVFPVWKLLEIFTTKEA